MAYDNKIRIIGGLFKGRKLEVIDMDGLRPTTDRVRETVFNWIGERTSGAAVLDLFAGSGALGLEALSRGAKSLTLVEKDADTAAILKSNISTLPDAAGEARVVNQDALSFLENFESKPAFDLIFLDPPFSSDLLEPAVELIVQKDLLNDGGVVYIEMNKAKKKVLFGLTMIRDGDAGQCHYGLYERSFFI